MKVFESYLSFVKKHKEHTFKSNDIEINYRLFGKGEQTILILMGSSMFPTEAYFKIIEPLAEEYKILTIDYPHKIRSITQLIDLIKDLIVILEIQSMTIFGASHGGSLAQGFASIYPQYVDHLILYNTLTKSKVMNQASKQIIIDVLAVIDELEELRKTMPLDSVKGVFLEQVEQMIVDDSEIDLFEHMIVHYEEKDEQLQMKLIKSFLTTFEFSTEDFSFLGNQVLILYGHDNDPFGGSELIETLVDLFDSPHLEFIESNRFSLIINADEIVSKINYFLKEKTA
jgi:hypothetical protein